MNMMDTATMNGSDPTTNGPRSPRWPWLVATVLSAAFLLWHQPWFSKPLTPAEIDAAFAVSVDRAAALPQSEKVKLRAFFSSDDGRPFYNVNLTLYREQATYPDGVQRPGIRTGSDAADAYARVVIPQLLRRGSYPVFISSKISNLLEDGAPGADFFQNVGIVRYRSRRDMLSMISDPDYMAGAPHKFASLAKNIAVPTTGFVPLDASVVIPLILFALAALMTRLGKRP
jgi:hypothetical protein